VGKGSRERTLALTSQLIWYLTKQLVLKETPPQKKEEKNEKERGDAPPIGFVASAARVTGRRGSPGCEREEHDRQVDGGAHSFKR
jgi:hypothetical protein